MPRRDLTQWSEAFFAFLIKRYDVGVTPASWASPRLLDLPQMMLDVTNVSYVQQLRMVIVMVIRRHPGWQLGRLDTFGRSYFSFTEAKKNLGKAKRILWCAFSQLQKKTELS